MFIDSMDCFITYNYSCINGSLVQLNDTSLIFGGFYDPQITIDEVFRSDLFSSTIEPISSSVLVSVQHCIITAIILGAIILSTITGNILVIVAVIREKTLHSVAYYLFVSLAVADLMVASMVMPIAVLKEVTREWVLGSIICDIWVMIDLLCCTASILHLVAIALDRYWAITNLDYATKRTPGRVLILILIIWITSILISSSHLFPVFRDKRGRAPGQCHLIGNVPFTIISTVGAFYIPLIGMCIIYWKIFQAARLRIRRRAFMQSPSGISPDEVSISVVNSRTKVVKKSNLNHNSVNEIETDNLSTHSSCASHQNDYELRQIKRTTFTQQSRISTSRLLSRNILTPRTTKNDLTIPINTIPNPLVHSSPSVSFPSRPIETRIIISDQSQSGAPKTITVPARKRIDVKRERKATKVLGVVMGCFILCWLPFFIEETVSGIFHLTINEKVISVLTWLGYLNSLLNPVIYTIFAPDFRQAFGKILFGRYRKRQRLKK